MKVNWWMWYRFSAKMIMAVSVRFENPIFFGSGDPGNEYIDFFGDLFNRQYRDIQFVLTMWRKKDGEGGKKMADRESEHEGGRIALYTWQIYAWNAFNQSQYLLKLLRPGFRMWGYIQIYFTMTSMLDKKKYGNPWQSLCWILGMHTFVGDLASLFFCYYHSKNSCYPYVDESRPNQVNVALDNHVSEFFISDLHRFCCAL